MIQREAWYREAQGQEAVAQALSKVLADTYVLYTKTQNFHWNVRGSDFSELHLLFGDQYDEMTGGVDLLAEQIRQVGARPPATLEEFLSLTSIPEEKSAPESPEMVRQLFEGNRLVSEACKQGMKVCEQVGDQSSLDILVQREQAHSKNAWMLRSILGQE